ncbi:hypothetical protein BC835DRAFT_1423907 [Cytidiella melzeri]|nr:hypothetical protein BC835DRAFT_1423907 [Cytidiella melzeri]
MKRVTPNEDRLITWSSASCSDLRAQRVSLVVPDSNAADVDHAGGGVFFYDMELPTSREIELETLLRQRDAQVAELTDEVAHLRQYLPTQPAPTVSDPISLPPPLVSLLLPLINSRSSTAVASSDTVTAALTQRVKVLQEENDELYEILKSGETGRLKEDVRSLRRVSQKLEGALREAHQVIESLS